MKPLADGQRPALAEDRADTTSGRCVTSRHPTRLCRLPDELREPQDPMSAAHISASAPTAQFKLASPPRSVVPEQRNSRCAGRVLDRRLGGDAAAPSIRSGAAPRPAVAVTSCQSPGKPWSSTKHSPSMGPPSRTSKRSASRSKYETRRRTVRTTHVPTLVVTVFAPRPRRMIRRCDLLASRHAATERSRQPRRPPISAHRRRRPSTALRRTAPTSSSDTDTPPHRGELPVDRGAAQRTTGADGSTRRTVIEAQPNSETSTRRSSSGR